MRSQALQRGVCITHRVQLDRRHETFAFRAIVAAVLLGNLNSPAKAEPGESEMVASVASLSRRLHVASCPPESLLQAPIRYGAGSFPWDVEVADLNGDEVLDFAVPQLLGGAAVFYGLPQGPNPGPLFGPPLGIQLGGHPTTLASGDFDNDGIHDLTVANDIGYMHFLRGTGDGQFAPPLRTSFGNPSISGVANLMVAAHLNSDSFLDLAIAFDGVRGRVATFMGAADGRFRSAGSIDVGTRQSGLLSRDFNYDGFDDLAVTTPMENTVLVLHTDGGAISLDPLSADWRRSRRHHERRFQWRRHRRSGDCECRRGPSRCSWGRVLSRLLTSWEDGLAVRSRTVTSIAMDSWT